MKAILFDLDNTLYDTQDYYLGAFQEISRNLSEKYHLNQDYVFNSITELWKNKTSMYPHLFDDLINSLGLSHENSQRLVKIFNWYKIDKKNLYADVIPTLKKLRDKQYTLGIITDGNTTRQQRKIKQLDLEKFFNVILYTALTESKPSSVPYSLALNKMGLKSSEVLYLGDNPHIDFEGAKKIGIRTVRISRGEFSKIPTNDNIDYTIKNLDELWEILTK